MILDCKTVADNILSGVKLEASNLIVNDNIEPCLALVRVLGDPASENYVKSKEDACKKCNIKTITHVLPEDCSNEDVYNIIMKCNMDININAIMLQLPLPKHLNEKALINTIDPLKDVDCLTVPAIGSLFVNEDIVQPCTPKGIMKVLKHHDIELEGKEVLIINRSMLVGKPLVELFQRENATVTLAHSKTKDLTNKIINSDIVITAVGKENFIDFELLHDLSLNYNKNEYKKKYFVDVSINRRKSNNKLCGDIECNNTEEREKLAMLKNIYITPVPTGIGLTTVASLLENTISLTKMQLMINKMK